MMSDNLGVVETEMPDDINAAVERGQKIAAGRVAYNKWLLTGQWDGDVAHLLEFAKNEIHARGSEIHTVEYDKERLEQVISKREAEIQNLEASNAKLQSMLVEQRKLENDAYELQTEIRHMRQDLEASDNALEEAHKDITSLTRTIRILSRGK